VDRRRCSPRLFCVFLHSSLMRLCQEPARKLPCCSCCPCHQSFIGSPVSAGWTRTSITCISTTCISRVVCCLRLLRRLDVNNAPITSQAAQHASQLWNRSGRFLPAGWTSTSAATSRSCPWTSPGALCLSSSQGSSSMPCVLCVLTHFGRQGAVVPRCNVTVTRCELGISACIAT